MCEKENISVPLLAFENNYSSNVNPYLCRHMTSPCYSELTGSGERFAIDRPYVYDQCFVLLSKIFSNTLHALPKETLVIYLHKVKSYKNRKRQSRATFTDTYFLSRHCFWGISTYLQKKLWCNYSSMADFRSGFSNTINHIDIQVLLRCPRLSGPMLILAW